MSSIDIAVTAPVHAPDVVLYTTEATPIRLSAIWAERPTLLFFMRHFGCAVCRAALMRLSAQQADFKRRNVNVVVIAMGDALAAAQFARVQRLSFLVLADPGRDAYRAFGLTEGTMREAVGPSVLLRQAGQALRGNPSWITAGGPSITQFGGVFIVGRDGLVHFSHVAQPIYNYPPISRYLEVFDTLV